VAYTDKAIDKAIARVFYDAVDASASPSPRLIGFDIEHKPETRKGSDKTVHLIQITSPSGDECLLLHVAAAGLSAMTRQRTRERVPNLVRLLGDRAIVAAGVGVDGDLDRLRSSHPHLFPSATVDRPTGAIAGDGSSRVTAQKRSEPDAAASAAAAHSLRTLDSQVVHLFYNPEDAGAGVAKLASTHGLRTSAQMKSVTLSDWSAAPLSARQIAYAAEDASLSHRIARRQFERYAPRDVAFETWSSFFAGVPIAPAAMDSRVAEILRDADRLLDARETTQGATTAQSLPEPTWLSVPPSMLAAFKRHHEAATALRAARRAAARWRWITASAIKRETGARGFESPVSVLEIFASHARRADALLGRDPSAHPRDADAMVVRYEHSREESEEAGSACVAAVTLRDESFTGQSAGTSETAVRELRVEARGRTKRAAKESAARGVLARFMEAVEGHWLCASAIARVVSLDPETRAEVLRIGPLTCGSECAGGGRALVGPRERRRPGSASPAHFADEAGWVSCAARRGEHK
jgi:hypothetical protein